MRHASRLPGFAATALAGALRALLDWALPERCAACGGASGTALCPVCRSRFSWIAPGACARCQAAPPAATASLCTRCLLRPSPLAGATAGAWYDGPAEEWLRRFKYPNPGLLGLDASASAVARTLVDAALALRQPLREAAIVPIPTSPRRLRERGFHPAAELARRVSFRSGLPLRTGLLHLEGEPAHQTGLTRAARHRNMSGAFRAGAARGRVILVDDVVTTGATLEAAARCLRGAGAVRVEALCAARARAPF